MAFNSNNKTTYTFVDEHNMVMFQNPSWNPNGDFGEGDSIGRTSNGYMAWKKHTSYITWGKQKFIEAVKKCFVLKQKTYHIKIGNQYFNDWVSFYRNLGNTYMQGYRHPNRVHEGYNDMSRDHTLYGMILMKNAGEEEFLKLMSKKIRYRISDRFIFTPDSWAWMKAVGGSKFAETSFYLMAIPIMIFSILWNKFVYVAGGFKEEAHQDDWIPISNSEKTARQTKWGKRAYPIYAMYETAVQLYVLRDSLGKKLMQKVMLWGTPKHNYIIKIILGAEVNKEDVYGYKPMTAWRFSTILNRIGRRGTKIITKPELIAANVLDVDLLQALYEISQK